MNICTVCNGRGFTEDDGSPIGRAFILGLQKQKEFRDDKNAELLRLIGGCLGFFQDMAKQQGGKHFAPDDAWLKPLRAAIAEGKAVSP